MLYDRQVPGKNVSGSLQTNCSDGNVTPFLHIVLSFVAPANIFSFTTSIPWRLPHHSVCTFSPFYQGLSFQILLLLFSLLTSFLHSTIFAWIPLFLQGFFWFSLLFFFFIFPSFSAVAHPPVYKKLFILVTEWLMVLCITLLTNSSISLLFLSAMAHHFS